MTETVHYSNMYGIHGLCQTLTTTVTKIDELKLKSRHHKDPQPGKCAKVAGETPKCLTRYGQTVCSQCPAYGDHEKTLELLHTETTEAMWGDVDEIHFRYKDDRCVQFKGAGLVDYKHEAAM